MVSFYKLCNEWFEGQFKYFSRKLTPAFLLKVLYTLFSVPYMWAV